MVARTCLNVTLYVHCLSCYPGNRYLRTLSITYIILTYKVCDKGMTDYGVQVE